MPVLSTMPLPLCSTAYATIPRPYAPALSSFFMCDGIDGVEQLQVPPLDLRLILSARLSHHRRISFMFSVVGRRSFPQFFVQTTGR